MLTEDKQQGTLKSRFDKLDSERQAVLERARLCSTLTIPSILPPEGSDDNTKLETPHQGVGARGVNNLASKLLLTLLPPNRPFFKISVDDFTLSEFSDNSRAEVEKSLNRIERAIFSEIETKAIRVPAFTALKHLIVTGNIATYQPKEGGLKNFRLDQYVTQRDTMGNLKEIIIKETLSPETLPEDIRNKILSKDTKDDEAAKDKKEQELELYTQVKLNEEGTKWEHRQEVKGETLEGSEGTFKLDENPYRALRWSAGAGENYGRGLVEEYLGDFLILEALSKATTEDSIIAARTVFLVSPTGSVRPKKFKDAANGDVIEGEEGDITTVKVDRHNDLQLILERISTLEERLAAAFLLFDAYQRDAERVTAEEIRRIARELENSLGGVYSVLSQEFQLPLVKRLMKQMMSQKRLPELPEEITNLQVVTGLEGLGRGNDLERLMTYIDIGSGISPDIFVQHNNMFDLYTRLGTALGFDMDGLLKDPQQLDIENQEAQLGQIIQQAAPQLFQQNMMQGANEEV